MPPEEVIERPLRGEAVSAALRFCGRSEELKQLTERWRLASDVAKPSPQVVVVKAERGIGKTRLVLEFYRWLSEQVDNRSGYWPDALSIVDRNLSVNPELENCKIRDEEIPYFWWGVRATDPGRENSVAGDAIATYDRYLAPHLVALLLRENARRTGKAVAKVWAEAIGHAVVIELPQLLKLAIPYFGLAVGVGTVVYKTQHLVREGIKHGGLDKAVEKPRSRADRALEDLERTFNPKSSSFAKTPGVIFVDDAQFASKDAALLSFAERLIHMAVTQRWPMMIVATQWLEFAEDKDATTFAGIIRHARTAAVVADPRTGLPAGYLDDQNYCEIDLRPLDDLSGALIDRLPGLTEGQRNAILERVGGNPRFLEQVISFLLERKKYFEGHDDTKALTAGGLDDALEKTTDIFDVVLARLNGAPAEVQEAVCLASVQGMQFSNSITEEFAQAAINRSVREPLAMAENPYRWVTGHGRSEARAVGEFAERLFYLVTAEHRESVPSLPDDVALQDALKNVLSARLDDLSLNEKLDVDDRALTYRLAANVFKRSNEIQEKVKGLVALVHLAALQESQQMWEQSNNTLRQLRDMFASAPDAGKAAPDWVVEYASRGIPDEEPSQHELKQMLFICNEYSDRQRATARRLDTEEAWQSYASSIHRVAFGLETVSSDNREAATRLHQQGCAIRRTLVERFNTPEAMKLLLSSLLFHHNNAAKDTTERIDLLKEELAVARTMEEKFPNKGLASVADVLLNLTLAYKELQNVSAATRYLSELEHVMCELEDKDPGSLRDSMFGDPTLLLVDFTEIQRQLRAPPT